MSALRRGERGLFARPTARMGWTVWPTPDVAHSTAPRRWRMTGSRRFIALGLMLAVLGIVGGAARTARAETTLRVVMHSDLKIVDPIWTTAYIVRNHGYMIYDTLFAMDAKGEIKPQMVGKYDLSADKLTYTMTLRDGLLWHDGKPVTAEDCVASIKRC